MRLFIAIFSFLVVASAARADAIDLSSLKCKAFLESGPAKIEATLAWLDGYYKDEDDPPVIDFDKLKDNGGRLSAYCTEHPDTELGTAAEELFGK